MNEYQKNDLVELEHFNEERKEAFKINDLESLTWAFKKLSSINAELKEKEDVADAEIRKIHVWYDEVSKPLKHSKEFFEYHIKAYHEKELSNNPNKKSISTPYGKVKSTTTKEQAAIKDESALLEYAIANYSDLIETKSKVMWGELKKKIKVDEFSGDMIVVDEFGQIVPGVEVKPKNTTFKIEGV